MTILSLYFPIFLSLSLPFLLPTIINLFRKNIHHGLSLLATILDIGKPHLNSQIHISPLGRGLGITTLTKDVKRLPNVPESKTVNLASPTTTVRRIGFMNDIGGKDNDDLISCTERSDERCVDHEIKETNNIDDDNDGRRRRMAESRGRSKRDSYGKNEVKSFPPPLSSLNQNGQPSFFLRSARKDGRLELTEVRIHRPEILHASRENGRLRLHLVPDESFLEDVKEEEEEELIQEEEEDITETEKEEKKKVDKVKYKNEWNLGMRCHEMVNHHHVHVHGSHHHPMQICGVSTV